MLARAFFYFLVLLATHNSPQSFPFLRYAYVSHLLSLLNSLLVST